VDLAMRRLTVVLMAAVAVLTLSGYLLKAQCVGHYNELRDSHLCSNDIQVLYVARGMHEHPFPYVHGDLVDHQLTGGSVEYPVLTGVFAWIPALVAEDDGSYLQLTALLLAPFSFLTAWLLSRMVRWRALIYGLSPPLVWYSFHNWDLLVVCATVGAFYAWWQRGFTTAAVLLAVGGGLKFWPLFLLLPLLLDRLSARDRAGGARIVASSAAVTAAINLPFVLINARGWWAAYAFQAERAADITSNSIWYWGFRDLSTDELNVLIPVLVLVGAAIACAVGWRRPGPFPFVQVSGAILCVFLLTNKAHSPQYALWLLPFFCLLRLRWGWWIGYLALDVCLYVGLFRWYYDIGQNQPYGLSYEALVIGVWGRIVMLALLFVVMLRSDTALGSLDERREGEAVPAAA
jgi:uncharacterized membrane protein